MRIQKDEWEEGGTELLWLKCIVYVRSSFTVVRSNAVAAGCTFTQLHPLIQVLYWHPLCKLKGGMLNSILTLAGTLKDVQNALHACCKMTTSLQKLLHNHKQCETM